MTEILEPLELQKLSQRRRRWELNKQTENRHIKPTKQFHNACFSCSVIRALVRSLVQKRAERHFLSIFAYARMPRTTSPETSVSR